MNTLENNRLIAEFMGYTVLEDTEEQCFVRGNEPDVTHIEEFIYHTSWNWLMPVVKKIELTYMYSVTICWEHCIIDKAGENREGFPSIKWYSSHKILATYNAVVEFIKWYNKNNL